MSTKKRRDPKATAGFSEDLSLTLPLAEKKIPESVPVAARVPSELWAEIQETAKRLYVTPSRLMTYGLSYFMQKLKDDPSILKFETRKELPKKY